MRALWIDAGNDPDWAKIQSHGMSALYFPVSDPAPDVKRRLNDARGRGFAVGVYMAWNWPQFAGKSGTDMAEAMHLLCTSVSPFGALKVQFDIEEHNPALIESCLTRWRALRPKQDTSWTLESFQGGWMTPDFVAKIIELRVRVVPQFYGGQMEPFAQDMALRDLTRRGFPEALVTGFYDAASLPLYMWDGFAFTMGRLP